MVDVKKEEKRLYIDAMFFHLIHSGYSEYKAEYLVRRIARDRQNITDMY